MGNFICKSCKSDSNSCVKKGGGIYANLNFNNNYALESGGCITVDGKLLTQFNGITIFNSNYMNKNQMF